MKHRLLKRAIVMMLTLAMLITSSGMLSFAESLAEGAATDNNDAVATEQAVEEEAVTDEAKEEAAPAAGEQKEEAAPAKESKESKEASSPAFEQSDKVDGVTITVTAEEGTFPEGAKLQVRSATKAEEKKADELVEKARDTEKNVASSYTFDISVVDKDGNELQPADGKTAQVSFKADEMGEDLLTPEVYHIDESGKTPEAEALDVEEKDGEAVAETEGFSTFQVNFTYEGLTYTLPAGANSVTLDQIMEAVGLTGKVRKASSDPADAIAVDPSSSISGGAPASTFTLTPSETMTKCDLIIALAGRPTYYVTVTKDGETPEHKIILRHMDGNAVSDSNPARAYEVLEVYVTGYSEAEIANLYFKYGSNGGGNYGRYRVGRSASMDPFSWVNGTGGASPSYTGAHYINPSGTKSSSSSDYTATSTILDITVRDGQNGPTVATYNQELTFNNSSNSNDSLQKDLNDVARSMRPIILYTDTSVGITNQNLIDYLGEAGIAHLKSCGNSPAPAFDSTPASALNHTTFASNVVTASSRGYDEVKLTLKKNNCAFHKNQSGTISFDVYVMGEPSAALSGNTLTVSDMNPWCSYQVVDADGNVIATKSPTLVDPGADDPDKAIDPNNNTLTFEGLTPGTYHIVEICDINFARNQGKATDQTVKIDGEESASITHVHSYAYSLSGTDTIVAECNADDCFDTNKGRVELSLSVNNIVYGETPSPTLTGVDAFNTATGQDVKTSDVKYYDSEGNEYTGSLTEMPAGRYTAKLTVEGVTAEASFNITRAQAATPAEKDRPVIAADGHDKIKVTNPVEGLRYTLLDENGDPVEGVAQIIAGTETELVFENLDPNTTYKVGVTTPEDSNHTESGPLISEPDTTDKAPQTAPGEPNASADAKDTISVSGAAAGMKYVFTPAGGGDPITVTIAADGTHTVEPASGFTATFEDGTLTVVGFTTDTAYNVTAAKLEDATHQESPESAATPVKTAKDAPAAKAGAKEGEAGNDGTITDVDDTMEYSANGGETWIPVPAGATEITGLAAGDYLVHYKAVPADSQPSSASTLVKVEKKASDQAFTSDDKITAAAETNKITVTAPVTSTEDPTEYEYRIDGGPWQKTTEFSGLEPGTMHKVEARKAETANSMPSDPIEANVATKALAPSEDKITTTATTLTIEDPESSTLYTVKDGNDNVVAKVKKDKDGNIITVSTADGVTVDFSTGDIVVGGLKQENTYKVTATKLNDDNEPISESESAPTEKSTTAHEHAWTYSASGNKLTAECSGEGDCGIEGSKVELALNIADVTYGTAPSPVLDNVTAFNAATGKDVKASDITYFKNGEEVEVTATSDQGTYVAKLAVKDGTTTYIISKEFKIKKQQETTPDESLTPVAVKNGYDKVNVNNPEEGYTYQVKDKNDTVVGTATVKADGTVVASPEGCATIEDGKLVFNGLQPNSEYTVEMYKAASDGNHSDSEKLTSNKVTTDKQPEQAPSKPSAAAKSKDSAEISGADTGNKYVLKAGEGDDAEEIVITFGEDGKPVVTPSGVTATIDESGKLIVSGLTPDTEYKVTAYKEPTDGDYCESAASAAATIKTAKEAPTTPEQKDLVGAADNDGSIKGVDSTMQYKDPETGEWKAISGTEITGLKPGNYEIRYKADGVQPASESMTVEVKSKSSDGEGREPINEKDVKTTTETQKITVTAPVKSEEDPTVYEYSLDGENWQTTTEFTKIKDGDEMKVLQPGTTYQLYVRKAETDTHMATTPTVVNVTTKPEKPDASKIETTATTLTIHDPEDSTKYEVKDEDGNVIATVKINSEGEVIGEPSAVSPATVTVKENGDIVVGGLEQEKTYNVVATKIDDNGTDISAPSDDTAKKTEAHEHSWKYAVDANGYKFTATCEGEGTCDHKADGSKPLSAELIAENKVYDGSAYAASITKSDDLAVSGASVGAIEYYDKDGNKLIEAPKKKGEYTAKAVVTVGTGESAKTYTLEKSFEITKSGSNAFPEGAKPTIADWTYGSEPSVPTCAAPAHGTVKYVYSDAENGTFTETVPTTAGTWYVKAIVEDSADYNACESGVTEFKIDPKPIRTSDVAWTTTSLTYNGQQQSVTPSVKASALVGEDVVNLTASDNQQTNAGNYTAKVTALSNPNYVLVPDEGKENIEQSWSIAKATDSPFANGSKPALDGWTYGDAAKTPSGPAAAFGADAIEYQYASSPSGSWSTTVPTDQGTYYVRAHLADCDNYSVANSDPQEFTIAKKKVTLTWPADPTYDGTEKDVTPTVTGLVTADEGKVSSVMDGDYKATDRKTSGQYTAKVTGLTGARADNYEIDSTAEKTHKWNLNKGPVDPPTGVSTKPDSKVEGVDNGSITGLDTTKPMEYRAKKADGTWGNWVTVPNGVDKVEGLKDGNYQVRYAETDNTVPSDPVDVTIDTKADQEEPETAPTVPSTGVTTTTITVNPTQPGYEYIVVPKGTKPEDYNWNDSKKSESGEAKTFDKDANDRSLTPGTDYEVICRKAETEDADASEPGPAAEVTTTPNAPADDSLSATPTRLTIEDPEKNTQYKVYDEDGNVVATVNVDKDGKVMEPVPDNVKVKDGDIVVEGLEPEKEYTVTKTKIDDKGNPKSNESAKSDPITTPALIPEDTPRKPAAESNSDGTATVELPKDGDKNVGMKYVITDKDGNETVIEVKEDGSVVNPTGGITGSIDEDGNLVIDGLASDSIYEIQAVKTPTDADNTDSERSQPPVKIKTAKEAPTSPEMKDKVGEKGNDGSIEGVDDSMEYYDPDDKQWKPVTGETIENLKPGDYKVRYKEVPASGDTPKQPASEPKTVKVEKKSSSQDPVDADSVKTDSTTNTVSVVDPDPAYEYSIDGGKTWIRPENGKPVTFDKDEKGKDLKPASTYEILVRKQETKDSMPSEPVKVSVSTVPEKPEKSDTEKDDNSITVDPTTPGVEYVVIPADQDAPTADDWAKSQTSKKGEPLTFDNLEPGKPYKVVARTPEKKNDDGSVTPASEPTASEPIYTNLPEPKTSETGTKVTVDDAKKGNEYILVPKGKKPTADDWANSIKPSEDGPVTFTGLEPSTEYDVYVRVEGNDETTSLKKTVKTDPAGEYIPETKTIGNVPEVLDVNGLDEALAKLLCSDDENAEVKDGQDAYLILEITDITGTVKANEKTLIEGFMAKISKNSTVAKYIDISLFKKVGDEDRKQLYDTKGNQIEIKFEVPENLRKKGRTFYFLRLHDGKVDVVGKTTGKAVTAKTDKFSTYALAYTDKDSGSGASKGVKTGDMTQIYLWAVVMVAAAALLLVLFYRRRRNER